LPTPFALYIFTSNAVVAEQLGRSRHPSGGACINDIMVQAANGHAPFEGVGTSGMGCYHARHIIDTFSRK
jgi:aldehyde dehydrogenase (NAD+)